MALSGAAGLLRSVVRYFDMSDGTHEIVEGVDLTPGAHIDHRGVDRTLIRYKLSLTPMERIAENERMIEFLATIRKSPDGAG